MKHFEGREFGRGGEAGSHRHKFRAERVSLSLKGFLFISFVLLSRPFALFMFLNWEYPYLHQYHELPTEDGIHMTIPGEQR